MSSADTTSELMLDLAAWLEEIGRPAVSSFAPLAGDVSLRRYFRVELQGGEPAIAAFYPNTIRPALTRFEAAARLLESAGVRVPKRLAGDVTRGWSLVEDLGASTLYDERGGDWGRLEALLTEAAEISGRIGAIDRVAVVALGNPPLDRELLRRELSQTEQTLLAPAGALDDPEEASALRLAFDRLCSALAAEPSRSCHRDFMARNLVRVGSEIGVLDFQDLRLGPADYDLASLLNDSLFPPEEVEARILERATGSSGPGDGYRRAVAQRALKAAGTFAMFAARGSDRHLGLIPPTLERASRHLLRLPETARPWRKLLRRSGVALKLPQRLLD